LTNSVKDMDCKAKAFQCLHHKFPQSMNPEPKKESSLVLKLNICEGWEFWRIVHRDCKSCLGSI
jgi:hypothetical protein